MNYMFPDGKIFAVIASWKMSQKYFCVFELNQSRMFTIHDVEMADI